MVIFAHLFIVRADNKILVMGAFVFSTFLKGACMITKRILLVDDVKLFLQLGKTMLTRRNITVDTAMSGTQALEKIVQSPPDLVFIDLYMQDSGCFRVTSPVFRVKTNVVIAVRQG